MYSSLIRNRIYDFLLQNNFIESQIQKGFRKGISETIEHTKMLSYLIDHARNKQRQLIITLLDLKNAFGEVDHDLLNKVLEYHYLPQEIQSIITEYYQNYYITI